MCGEGGEYETFTLDCPIFNKRIVMYVSLVTPPSNIVLLCILSDISANLLSFDSHKVEMLGCMFLLCSDSENVQIDYRLHCGIILRHHCRVCTLLSTTSDLLLPASSVGHLSETKKQEGCRKRGRPHLRWEDCVKRDPRKAEEEEKWREKANNRDQQKRITKVAVVTTTPDLPLQNVKHEEKQESCPSSS